MTAAKTLSLAAVLLASTALSAQAESMFNRVASFAVASNLPAGKETSSTTSSEIIAATPDGMTLIYSDSPLGGIGFVDIADPKAPKAGGFLDMDGEPTSVTVIGAKAFVGVNTSESKTAPSGRLDVVDIATKTIESSCDIGGQPDSVAASADGTMIAIAIENERDEDLADGVIPQLPAGNLTIVPVTGGTADCAGLKVVDLTGIAEIAPTDPEPEFVDFNDNGEIVVSMQENNHIAIVDGKTATVTAHFTAGMTTLENVDLEDDGALSFTETQADRLREPDSVKWIDNDRFIAANEGDYEGGSRGVTIFGKDGTVLYESGGLLDHLAASVGHYPDKRSDAKGVEPEGLEVARFDDETLMFVLAERASVAFVFRDSGGTPEYVQTLPSGIAPEGAVAVPGRNLFVTANEADLVEDGGARSHVMIYERAEGVAAYPHILWPFGDNEVPTGWGALSGLAADPEAAGKLFAVSDSFYEAQPTIFAIDATKTPAEITAAIRVTKDGAPAEKLDLEGIAPDGAGGFWLASEGDAEKEIAHQLLRVDAKGAILEEVPFPAALLEGQTRFGAEGVAGIGDVLWIAMQREWKDDKPGTVKLVAYDTAKKEWGAVAYPLEPKGDGWVGLSEIAVHGDNVYIVERDNLIGAAAKLKKIFSVAVADLKPAALGSELPVVAKTEVRDLLPDLTATGGYVVDKVEGFTIDKNGTGYVVTDNDGVDDSSGETLFFGIGKVN